MRKNRKMQKKQ